ncbi:MAG: hypothetical protein M1837_007509 [Sclerophora amabilis]|nr:MAG: hypothetical protein M1837_007509 [Sclerophora amabilis]
MDPGPAAPGGEPETNGRYGEYAFMVSNTFVGAYRYYKYIDGDNEDTARSKACAFVNDKREWVLHDNDVATLVGRFGEVTVTVTPSRGRDLGAEKVKEFVIFYEYFALLEMTVQEIKPLISNDLSLNDADFRALHICFGYEACVNEGTNKSEYWSMMAPRVHYEY